MQSSYFDEEASRIRENLPAGESVLGAYNITQPATRPPFKFGFVFVTSERLFKILYKSSYDKTSFLAGLLTMMPLIRSNPTRPHRRHLEIWTRSASPTCYLALQSPTYPLSKTEISSRRVVIVSYPDVLKSTLESRGDDHLYYNLQLKLTNGRKEVISFLLPEEGKKVLNFVVQNTSQSKISV